MTRVHFVHPRVQQSHYLKAGLIGRVEKTCFFGHNQQGANRQHLKIGAKRQPLRHRTGGAQAGKRARTAAKGDGIELRKRQTRLDHQGLNGRNQVRRGLRATGAGVVPDLRGAVLAVLAALHGDGHGIGAGVKGEQVHIVYTVHFYQFIQNQPLGPVYQA